MSKKDIDDAIEKSSTLLFLGFGFEEQNMRFFDQGRDDVSVFATGYGLSRENQKFIVQQLTNLFSHNSNDVRLIDGKSAQLFTDFYHPLTASVGSL